MKKSFINIAIIATVLAFSAGLHYWFQNKTPNMKIAQIEDRGRMMANAYRPADFDFKTINGKAGSFYALEDKVVMIHFWATWCPPCIVEFPDLIKLAQVKNENLVILAISLDENPADMDRFFKKLKTPLPDNFLVIQDNENRIPKEFFGKMKLPESYIFTQGLTLARTIKGPQDDWDSEKWRNTIQLFHDLPY